MNKNYTVGKFFVKAEYCVDIGEGDYKVETYDGEVEISEIDYDYDSGFPEDQETEVMNRKVAEKLPKDHFDIGLLEWEQVTE